MTVAALQNVEVDYDRGRALGPVNLSVAAGEVAEVPVRLQADPASLTQRSTPVYFRLQAVDTEDLSTEQSARFLGPTR